MITITYIIEITIIIIIIINEKKQKKKTSNNKREKLKLRDKRVTRLDTDVRYSETRPSRGKSRERGDLGGRRSRDGVWTRARRMAGMNGPRQTAGNARDVASRARSPVATTHGDARAV